MIGDQVSRGGYKVQVRGQTDAEKIGGVLLGTQNASVLKAETAEKIAERERLERESMERGIGLAQREEQVRGRYPACPTYHCLLTVEPLLPAQAANAGRVSMPGQPAAPMPTPAPVPDIQTPPVTAGVCKARAMFDCEAETEGDLSFKAGDIVTVTKKDDSGYVGFVFTHLNLRVFFHLSTLNFCRWWEGTCNGLSGTFPGNYVEEI